MANLKHFRFRLTAHESKTIPSPNAGAKSPLEAQYYFTVLSAQGHRASEATAFSFFSFASSLPDSASRL
jgi:hypothetical protein